MLPVFPPPPQYVSPVLLDLIELSSVQLVPAIPTIMTMGSLHAPHVIIAAAPVPLTRPLPALAAQLQPTATPQEAAVSVKHAIMTTVCYNSVNPASTTVLLALQQQLVPLATPPSTAVYLSQPP